MEKDLKKLGIYMIKKENKMEILILNEKQMKEIIKIEEAIENNKLALKAYSNNEGVIPLRSNLNIEEFKGQSLYMPGYLASENALGVKLVSVYPENRKKGLLAVPSLMLLVDDATGFPNCIMDGSYLTQLRTGAISGSATDILSRKDSSIFTLIGTGGQGALQLEAVLSVRDIKTAYVFDINKENMSKFAKEMQENFGEKYGVEIREALDLEDAIRQSDIITSVTTSREKTFDGNWVKPGSHINGVGSYTPEMSEIDGNLVIRANKVYCDTRDAVIESGDFVKIINQGIFKEEDITGELGEVLLGRIPSRENDEEITFFETTGNAIFDITAAKKIYDLAKEKNIATSITI